MQFFPTVAAFLALAATSVSAACLEQIPLTPVFPIAYEIDTTINDAVSFGIPANSVGPCQLVAKFPAGYPIISTGSDLVNVRAVDGPAAGALVGDLRFRAGTTTVINSFACRDVMSFELSLAEPTEGSRVSFSQIKGAGLFLEVGDCQISV
ncbi:hypothetical protein GGR53DRAFT_398724 [Hypoxylon sp. FL1150]|nr:hypothetical protein GGR53DRAFT_398724 [Hypoxylon sp. FL1150]